jgi:hypothetical protein
MRDITRDELDRLRDMSFTVVHLGMCDDEQPERALFNWLNDFSEYVASCEMVNKDTGKVSAFDMDFILSVLSHFVEVKKDVAAEESGVAG